MPQNVAGDPHAQNARVEPSTTQTLSTKDATGPSDTKPGLEAAKIEMRGPRPEASGKVERLRPKSSEKASKATERFDRIGLEIAAVLATTAPAADLSIAAAGPKTGTKRTPRCLRSIPESYRPRRAPSAGNCCGNNHRKQREPKRPSVAIFGASGGSGLAPKRWPTQTLD